MSDIMEIKKLQKKMQELKVEAWLFYDVFNRDRIAYDILGLDFYKKTTRRWYYLVSAEGIPIKIVSQVEAEILNSLDGKKVEYANWEQLFDVLKEQLSPYNQICMQYSENAEIPNISNVDAGTIDLIKSFGIQVVSSANLLTHFYSRVNQKQHISHVKAGDLIQNIKEKAFQYIFEKVQREEEVTECEVQGLILDHFKKNNLLCEASKPIVAVNEHAADPHFDNSPVNDYKIKKNDKILIDLWARLKEEDSIYYDITWCGFAGKTIDPLYQEIFKIAVEAREETTQFIIKSLQTGNEIKGCDVDDYCRAVIRKYGYADYFFHRTGHSIYKSAHGNGTNMDNYETHDKRPILNNTCFSIEPGIYLRDRKMGVRTEINVLIDENYQVIIHGDRQMELLTL